jgi:hypothetical protein
MHLTEYSQQTPEGFMQQVLRHMKLQLVVGAPTSKTSLTKLSAFKTSTHASTYLKTNLLQKKESSLSVNHSCELL